MNTQRPMGANMRRGLKKVIRYFLYGIGAACAVEFVLVTVAEYKIGFSIPYLLIGTAFFLSGLLIIFLADKYVR